MPTYVKINDGTDLYLPGYGKVRAGSHVEVSEAVAKACGSSLVLASSSAFEDPPVAAPEPETPVVAEAPDVVEEDAVEEDVVEESSEPLTAEDLAIESYDTARASDIVSLLDETFTQEELLAIREYEAANKGRTTVLSEVDRLLEKF